MYRLIVSLITLILHGIVLTNFFNTNTKTGKFFDKFIFPPSDLIRDIPSEKLHKEYDFVVIGGGSSGSVVASRLSEVRRWRVLLLEAGGDEITLSDVPLFSVAMFQTDLNWHYRSSPQTKACLGYKNRQCLLHRGHVLGGTSVLNAMIYHRGYSYDYDSWEAAGLKGWKWNEVQKYFLKSENASGPLSSSNLHSSGGPLATQYVPFKSELGKAFIDSQIELGYSKIDVSNGKPLQGYSWMPLTMKDGSRLSTNKAFLRPLRHRSNLHVAKNAYVTKVLISESKVARGVEFYRNGKLESVKVRKEIVLSAGTYNTPKILMHSGIGSKSLLDSVGIPVVHHLRGVGRNLQDRLRYEVDFTIDWPISLRSLLINDFVGTITSYLNKSGPLTLSGAFNVVTFLKWQGNNGPVDTEHLLGIGTVASDYGIVFHRAVGHTAKTMSMILADIGKKDGYRIDAIYSYPKSIGTVQLSSKDPFEPPIIDHNYLSDPKDLAGLLFAVKEALKVGTTNAMGQYNSQVHMLRYKPCLKNGVTLGSDNYWKCMIRHFASPIYHPCCTAKMGNDSDPFAVLDARLQVRGIKGLRVADASAMPKLVGGHLNAPCIMIGERVADFIKRDHLRRNLVDNQEDDSDLSSIQSDPGYL